MFDISRRNALGFLATGVLSPAAAVASAPPVAEPVFDLQAWLDTAPASDVMNYHAARLTEVMGQCDPTKLYRFKIDRIHGFALICGDAIESPTYTARVFVDDGSPLRADDVTETNAFSA